jgi:hypothetical protein
MYFGEKLSENSLKGPWHEIFDLCFFKNKSTPPRPLIHGSQLCQLHRCAVCSRVRFPYKKQCVELFAKIFEKKLVAQQCQ